jgi:rhodanese-related sulfurtransferase
MRSRLALRSFVIMAILAICLPVLASCSNNVVASGGGNTFETVRQAADKYVNSDVPMTITSKELYDKVTKAINLTGYLIEWYNPATFSTGPIIVDVRSPDDETNDVYPAGHIPGSIYIPWRQITTYENLTKLPKDRDLVIYSNSGETSAQVVAILNVLGYKAASLKWGIGGWTDNASVITDRYDLGSDTLWGGVAYRAVSESAQPEGTYNYPALNLSASGTNFEVVRSAADSYLSTPGSTTMSAPELFQRIHFNDQSKNMKATYFNNPNNPAATTYMAPFILDIRNQEAYGTGHIEGSLNIPLKDLFKTNSLHQIPTDQQILVCDDTGNTCGVAVALLNMLGYDAISLRWGLASWAISLPSSGFVPDRFNPSKDVMNYPVVMGWQSYLLCPG